MLDLVKLSQMNKHVPQKHTGETDTFPDKINAKTMRKLKARRNHQQRVWFGLGMMGLIGWSVAVPTILGASVGLYLDKHYPHQPSWTLSLLVAGLCLGCFNAWHWVSKEEQAIHEEQQEDNKND